MKMGRFSVRDQLGVHLGGVELQLGDIMKNSHMRKKSLEVGTERLMGQPCGKSLDGICIN